MLNIVYSSTTQSSRKLNITLGWQKIPEDIRVVSDDPFEKCSAKVVGYTHLRRPRPGSDTGSTSLTGCFFKLAVTVHRCLNGRAPPYLSDYCVPVADVDTRQHLRSVNRQLLAVPRYRLNTYGCRAFSVAGSTVWNSFPDFIWDPTVSADCFRRMLKTYLFARY